MNIEKYVRSCANCFWNISDYDVDEILEQNNYKEEDPDYPVAGCGLALPSNKKWPENYYCKNHSYIDGIFDNYVLYDNRYLGPGYFIISELNGAIAKFAKIYISNNDGFPHYNFIAYEKGAIDQETKTFREIDFPIEQYQLETLYNSIFKFALSTNGESIITMDSTRQGKNQFKASIGKMDASLIFSKDIYGIKEATDFVNINIGDYMDCRHYEALNDFYQSLGKSIKRETSEHDIQKILKMTI